MNYNLVQEQLLSEGFRREDVINEETVLPISKKDIEPKYFKLFKDIKIRVDPIIGKTELQVEGKSGYYWHIKKTNDGAYIEQYKNLKNVLFDSISSALEELYKKDLKVQNKDLYRQLERNKPESIQKNKERKKQRRETAYADDAATFKAALPGVKKLLVGKTYGDIPIEDVKINDDGEVLVLQKGKWKRLLDQDEAYFRDLNDLNERDRPVAKYLRAKCNAVANNHYYYQTYRGRYNKSGPRGTRSSTYVNEEVNYFNY